MAKRRSVDGFNRLERRRYANASAKTAWTGTLQEGSGQVEMTSSGVGTFEVSFPKRAADDAGGTTSPGS